MNGHLYACLPLAWGAHLFNSEKKESVTDGGGAEASPLEGLSVLLKGSSLWWGKTLSSCEQGLVTEGLLRAPAAHDRGKLCCLKSGPRALQPDTGSLHWIDNLCLSGLAVQSAGSDDLSLFPLSLSFLSFTTSLSQSASLDLFLYICLTVCFCLCIYVCFFLRWFRTWELGENSRIVELLEILDPFITKWDYLILLLLTHRFYQFIHSFIQLTFTEAPLWSRHCVKAGYSAHHWHSPISLKLP